MEKKDQSRLKRLSVILVLLVLLGLPGIVSAEDGEKEGILSVVAENDIFNSDRYYTNGIRISWLSAPGENSEWALRLASYFPYFPSDATVQANYSIGQNMYTATDIEDENPSEDDRPYAGWIYASVGLIAETGLWLDQLELTVGMVGPASMAEQTQTAVHKIIDSPDPQGWDYQLHNEPGVVLLYQRSYRHLTDEFFYGLPFDVTPHMGGALGNVFTHANAGFTLRYGSGVSLDYGPPRIQPGMPGSGYFEQKKCFGWYVFAGLEGRWVIRNIFLDGNTFEDSRSVDKEKLVGDVQYGLVLSYDRYRFSFTNVVRTREYRAQPSKSQSFGAISFSVGF